jgi:hypothetical protein
MFAAFYTEGWCGLTVITCPQKVLGQVTGYLYFPQFIQANPGEYLNICNSHLPYQLAIDDNLSITSTEILDQFCSKCLFNAYEFNKHAPFLCRCKAMDKGSLVTISILLCTGMKCRLHKTRLFAYSSGLFGFSSSQAEQAINLLE